MENDAFRHERDQWQALAAAADADKRKAEAVAAEQAGEIEELRALLREAIEDWIEVGYRPSHEDVAAFRDICARIEKALK
jgi:hypothetical protein